jgi:hypothetical protein
MHFGGGLVEASRQPGASEGGGVQATAASVRSSLASAVRRA